jgi:hypothetical protein
MSTARRHNCRRFSSCFKLPQAGSTQLATSLATSLAALIQLAAISY